LHRAGTLRNGRSRGANRLVIAVLILDVRTVSVRDFVVAIRRTLDLGGGGITVTRPSITDYGDTPVNYNYPASAPRLEYGEYGDTPVIHHYPAPAAPLG